MKPRISFKGRVSIVDDNGFARITPHELKILLALMGRPEVAKETLIEILYPDPDKEPDWADSRVKVAIWSLRKKLRQFGWTISSRYTYGWSLCEI